MNHKTSYDLMSSWIGSYGLKLQYACTRLAHRGHRSLAERVGFRSNDKNGCCLVDQASCCTVMPSYASRHDLVVPSTANRCRRLTLPHCLANKESGQPHWTRDRLLATSARVPLGRIDASDVSLGQALRCPLRPLTRCIPLNWSTAPVCALEGVERARWPAVTRGTSTSGGATEGGASDSRPANDWLGWKGAGFAEPSQRTVSLRQC